MLASSKIEIEMRPIAKAIGIDHPIVIENGANIEARSRKTEHGAVKKGQQRGDAADFAATSGSHSDCVARKIRLTIDVSLRICSLFVPRRCLWS